MNHLNHGHLVTDPVCGMRIDPDSAAGRRDWKGRTIRFCSAFCASKFRAEPEKYPDVPRVAKEERA